MAYYTDLVTDDHTNFLYVLIPVEFSKWAFLSLGSYGVWEILDVTDQLKTNIGLNDRKQHQRSIMVAYAPPNSHYPLETLLSQYLLPSKTASGDKTTKDQKLNKSNTISAQIGSLQAAQQLHWMECHTLAWSRGIRGDCGLEFMSFFEILSHIIQNLEPLRFCVVLSNSTGMQSVNQCFLLPHYLDRSVYFWSCGWRDNVRFWLMTL